MEFQTLSGQSMGRVYIQSFGGINRRSQSAANELEECVNMTSDEYPFLKTAKSPEKLLEKENIQAVCAPKADNTQISAFTGVAGGVFYYNGTAAEFESEDMVLEGNIQLADFGGVIIICPQMYYFKYTPDYESESNDIDYTVYKMEKGIYNMSALVRGETEEDDNGNVTDYINYIKVDDIDFEDYFKSGDSVFISGLIKEKNNSIFIESKYQTADDDAIVSAIVEKVDGEKLYLKLYNRKGKQLTFEDESADAVSVYIKIPSMCSVAVHNNRLWGVNPNGEQVYASKIGDPFNFMTFSGLASDSWYSEVGTSGEFVGIVSYRDNVVAFKKDFIHHVYGDKPINFNIPKQLADCGCIDIRSAVEVGAVLYYLGYNGFYAYSGGQPLIISDKLNCKYKKAVGWTDGIKYWAEAEKENGDKELLCFDTRYNIWLCQSSINVIGCFRWNNDCIVASDNVLYKMNAGAYESWSITFCKLDEGTVNKKSITDIFITAELKSGARMKISTITEDGFERTCREVIYTGIKAVRIPARFENGDYYRIKVSGEGEAVIRGIERSAKMGGRNYSVHL